MLYDIGHTMTRHDVTYYNITGEISATIVFLLAMVLLYMFRATISPIIRSTYAVYGHR